MKCNSTEKSFLALEEVFGFGAAHCGPLLSTSTETHTGGVEGRSGQTALSHGFNQGPVMGNRYDA